MICLGDFYGISERMLWEFYGILMGFTWGSRRDFIWYFYEVSMGFLWNYYGIPMAFL
jgi:hypothetical protein